MIGSWLLGPQLIGLLFIVIGFLLLTFPPKKINDFYGYRMPSAQENQAKWDEAQRYAGSFMMKIGVIYTLTGLLLAALLHILHWPYRPLMPILSIFAGISAPVLLIVFTERHLDHVFKN